MAIVAVAGLCLLLGWQAAVAIAPYARRLADSDFSGTAIDLASVSASRLVRSGVHAIRVEGRITNRTGRRQRLEAVDIVVTGQMGEPLHRWTHIPALAYLEAGQTIRFSTANGNIPALASGVEVRLAGLSKKAGL